MPKIFFQKALHQVHQTESSLKKLTLWTYGLTQVHLEYGVVVNRPELTIQPDLYLEGSDQYRGWFNSSLITSVYIVVFHHTKQLLSQGFALDGKGEKDV